MRNLATAAEARQAAARARLAKLQVRLAHAEPPPEPPASGLLVTREVAAWLQVSQRTVVEWAQKGTLPSFKTPGGRRRYHASDVAAVRAAMWDEPVTGQALPDDLQARDLVSTGEASRMLGVAPGTITRWCDDGLMPGAWRLPGGDRGAGHWRIPRELVDRMLADQGGRP